MISNESENIIVAPQSSSHLSLKYALPGPAYMHNDDYVHGANVDLGAVANVDDNAVD